MTEKRKRGNLSTRGSIDAADKEFECEACGKKYARYPSLYTHIKLKHERKVGLKTVVPELKPKLNRNREIASDVPIVDINPDTLNLFCQVQFLDLFKEIKELAATNDSIWQFIRSEKEDITQVNEEFLERGSTENLSYIWISWQAYQNVWPPKMDLQELRNSGQDIDEIFNESSKKHYRDFFIIIKELLKPISQDFSMEMCYLFDKIIQLSQTHANRSTFKDDIEQNISLYYKDNANLLFRQLKSIPEGTREQFFQKLSKNIAGLFK
ncbi:zinc finger, C2H2 type family protein (macronuclear) [Tetrahymena thermophila SB210]|uniref:Zinc finger, C2H2 type family protein n=1 Tax=Tetrahymena thermophila (strain SB210) TaxID=312017 RepID=I7M5X5_TETTS|nr:zinc finger, C2H2 type family protein [Tetrahymena thermophila SB210]EAR83761.1 zinc finger, C2H2 type family protein [Tetrahymena thermophila SB210]|eukprot:XP_001031424.1 zinc finger, C2H2 type family protein [Tetrahymena thermophila SB210]